MSRSFSDHHLRCGGWLNLEFSQKPDASQSCAKKHTKALFASCECLTDSDFSFFQWVRLFNGVNLQRLFFHRARTRHSWALTRLRQVSIFNEMQSNHMFLSADILLRLEECWIQGEDTLKCDIFQIESKYGYRYLE